MYRVCDPFAEWRKFFTAFMPGGVRHFYTRKERIEQLEQLKKTLQREIAGIDELIEELRGQEAKKK